MVGWSCATEVTVPEADITATPPAVAADVARLDAALDQVMPVKAERSRSPVPEPVCRARPRRRAIDPPGPDQ